MKTCIALSAAAHLAVLFGAVSAHRIAHSTASAAATGDVMLVNLRAFPEGDRPPQSAENRHAAAAAEKGGNGNPTGEAGGIAATVKGAGDALPAGSPRREFQVGDFARMAFIREMTAKTMMYRRSAPKEFEGILRSTVPPAALRGDGVATVLIGIRPSGAPGSVDIRSESAALKSALGAVPWEAAPLPGRYRIPCSAVKVNVSVTGERLAVGVEIL